MTDSALPRTIRIGWRCAGIVFVPALAWHIYEATVVRFRTGVVADAVAGMSSELDTIILFFGAVPLLGWIAAGAIVAVRRGRGPVRGTRRLWLAIALSLGAFGLSRLPDRQWDALMLRTVGPGRFGGGMIASAMETKDTARIVSLVAQGVSIDAPDDDWCGSECGDGETPLMLAARWGSVPLATFLLAHGADPNRTNENAESPLMRAVAAHSLPTVRLLIAHGANVDAPPKGADEPHRTLMQVAEYIGDSAIIRELKAAAKR